MASTILHIKDSYYFEISRELHEELIEARTQLSHFPTHSYYWLIRHDEHFLDWEAKELYKTLKGMPGVEKMPSQQELFSAYTQWQHADHAREGAPLYRYLEESKEVPWYTDRMGDPEWLKVKENSDWVKEWKTTRKEASSVELYKDEEANRAAWTQEKCETYNELLHGKIVIPQPFGRLRNLYEKETGFCISKFMVIEFVVALIMIAVFAWLGLRIRSGGRPRGRVWNLLEAMLVFIRDQVAKPAIGHDAAKFLPILWTLFFFILGCNLMGMIPWVGSPTGVWGVTLALALVTFSTVIISGSLKFGIVGFWKNQVPTMDLPLAIAIIIKPMIFVIEVIGLFIKHAVLSVRLLANMMAGHLVLLGIMLLAFSFEGVAEIPGSIWPVVAFASLVGATLFSCLELFVAFLQAYIFTFLSALFIGAATHRH